jgi:hypothetical protein
MAPYLSLFVHESHRKLRASDPALASLLSSDVEAIVARSRHSLKLFEDTHRGVAGQLAYFRDELLPAHRRRFLGNTWLPLARPLEKDLGLISYAGKQCPYNVERSTFQLSSDEACMRAWRGTLSPITGSSARGPSARNAR